MASTPLSIAVLAACVILILVAHEFVVIFLALRRCGGPNADLQERAASGEEGRCKGLSAIELETLPCHCHDFTSNCTAAADCVVCLEAFEAGDRCRRLPQCEHRFHAKCIEPWLEKSRRCPICRADVVPQGELVRVAGVVGALAMAAGEDRSSPAATESL